MLGDRLRQRPHRARKDDSGSERALQPRRHARGRNRVHESNLGGIRADERRLRVYRSHRPADHPSLDPVSAERGVDGIRIRLRLRDARSSRLPPLQLHTDMRLSTAFPRPHVCPVATELVRGAAEDHAAGGRLLHRRLRLGLLGPRFPQYCDRSVYEDVGRIRRPRSARDHFSRPANRRSSVPSPGKTRPAAAPAPGAGVRAVLVTTEPTSGPSRSGMNPRRRSLATAWSATVVVVACLVGAGSARSTLPAYNGEIAFTTGTATVGAPFYAYWYTFAPGSEPEWPVAVSNPCDFDAGRPWGIGFVKDGGCVSLTNPDGIEPFYDVAPVWSPDGTELAFVRITQGSLTGRLYTIGIDGSNLQQLTACETADAWLDWSSQGEIFYTCSDPGHTGAFLWPSGRASCGRPGASFSPDGTRIAYPHGVAMIAPAVAPLDPATGAPACPDPVIPSPLVAANAVAWSPDQRKLAIGNHDGVWVMNTNGTAI